MGKYDCLTGPCRHCDQLATNASLVALLAQLERFGLIGPENSHLLDSFLILEPRHNLRLVRSGCDVTLTEVQTYHFLPKEVCADDPLDAGIPPDSKEFEAQCSFV
jgi:hypothetical protein